jgi:hypothetical protein
MNPWSPDSKPDWLKVRLAIFTTADLFTGTELHKTLPEHGAMSDLELSRIWDATSLTWPTNFQAWNVTNSY